MNDNEIKNILKKSKTIAMIGISSEKKGEDKKKFKKKTCQCRYEIHAGFWLQGVSN
mgnify:CR=1 FL=1